MADQMHYDTIVIGAGQAGGPLSSTLAGAGRKTALIEREHIGGTCINVGCTPTKTMIASGRIAHLARRAADYGVGTGNITVDQKVVRQRKRDIVESFRSGSERRITRARGSMSVSTETSRTNAPSPARISMSPRLCSARRASRTEVRLTMNFSARSRSGGSRSPDLSRPSPISCLTCRTISS